MKKYKKQLCYKIVEFIDQNANEFILKTECILPWVHQGDYLYIVSIKDGGRLQYGNLLSKLFRSLITLTFSEYSEQTVPYKLVLLTYQQYFTSSCLMVKVCKMGKENYNKRSIKKCNKIGIKCKRYSVAK